MRRWIGLTLGLAIVLSMPGTASAHSKAGYVFGGFDVVEVGGTLEAHGKVLFFNDKPRKLRLSCRFTLETYDESGGPSFELHGRLSATLPPGSAAEPARKYRPYRVSNVHDQVEGLRLGTMDHCHRR